MSFAGTTHDQPIRSGLVVVNEPAHDVGRLYDVFVNMYFVGTRGGPWVLVDTGLPHTANLVRRRAAARFGADSRPVAIVLTHGHFDHAGNVIELAREWDVPVYAHTLELPYMTGRSDYPPGDPTVGGALGVMSRAFPHGGIDLGERVHALPADGSVPGMEGWRWLHTPGHTAGHVSLFRERDRFLISGDVVATVDQDSPLAMFNLSAEFSVPPAPFTSDWSAARASVAKVADLRPRTVAAGHGRPVSGSYVAADLARFAEKFQAPRGGRYSTTPAVADERGVVWIPPAVKDPLPGRLLLAGLVAGGAYLIARSRRD